MTSTLGERNYGPPVDMWGAGCIMAEMWTRSPIMQVTYQYSPLHSITSNLLTVIPGNIWLTD